MREASAYERIAGVMLNWVRPDNVDRIVEGWQRNERVGQCIVWNNNARMRPTFLADRRTLLVTTSHSLSLNSRFIAAALAEYECVLIQDDDIELPPQTIKGLHEAWCSDPHIIHGIFGRHPDPDGTYNYLQSPEGECPIILTRALLFSRSLICRAIFHLLEFEQLQMQGTPNGNGEDIIFSYVVRKYSGRLNRIHHLPVVELPDLDAVWRRKGHLEHRTNVVRACEAWLLGTSKVSTL